MLVKLNPIPVSPLASDIVSFYWFFKKQLLRSDSNLSRTLVKALPYWLAFPVCNGETWVTTTYYYLHTKLKEGFFFNLFTF